DVSVTWAERARRPGDLGLVRATDADGYVRAAMTLELDRVDVPIVVVLVPALRDGALRFDVRVRARLDFGNRVANWVSDQLDGDARSRSRRARRDPLRAVAHRLPRRAARARRARSPLQRRPDGAGAARDPAGAAAPGVAARGARA